MNRQAEIDFTAAQEARDTGIERAGANADRNESGWRYQAMALLVAFAADVRRPFLVEEARAWSESRGLPAPPDGRAWGSVVRLAKSKRRIEKTGFAPAASSNCSPKCLWQSAGASPAA